MPEEINNNNIFFNPFVRIKDADERLCDGKKSVSFDDNIFKTGNSEYHDVKKVMDTAENYTKEKYGNSNFLDKSEELCDWTDEVDFVASARETIPEKIIDSTNRKMLLSEDKIIDENGNETTITIQKDKDGNIIKSETDNTGQTTITVESHDQNGYKTEKKTITSPNGKPIYFSERTENPVNLRISEKEIIYDEAGRVSQETRTETNKQGIIDYSSTDSYEYFEYKGNTKDLSETVKINHTSPLGCEENYTSVETHYLATGEVNKTHADSRGKISSLYDKNGKLISEEAFLPSESRAFDKNMTDFDKQGTNNDPGEYIRYEYTKKGKPKIISAYRVDETGKSVEFTENEKAQSLLAKIGYDGKVGSSEQRSTGDCWVLSDLNSLSYSKKGREILSEALEYNDEGAVVHTYFGDYELSYTEIEAGTKAKYTEEGDGFKGNKYSTGDIDVLAFELTAEKIREDIAEGIYIINQDDIIDGYDGILEFDSDDNDLLGGGWNSEMIYYLTGNQSDETNNDDEELAVLNEYADNPDTTALNCGFTDECIVTDADGNEITLYSGHAYAIKSFEGENVTIVNPWDSSIDIVISADDFLEYSDSIVYTDLSTVEKDNGLFDQNDAFAVIDLMSSVKSIFCLF